jgi:uncharacterized membrane protein YccC
MSFWRHRAGQLILTTVCPVGSWALVVFQLITSPITMSLIMAFIMLLMTFNMYVLDNGMVSPKRLRNLDLSII